VPRVQQDKKKERETTKENYNRRRARHREKTTRDRQRGRRSWYPGDSADQWRRRGGKDTNIEEIIRCPILDTSIAEFKSLKGPLEKRFEISMAGMRTWTGVCTRTGLAVAYMVERGRTSRTFHGRPRLRRLNLSRASIARARARERAAMGDGCGSGPGGSLRQPRNEI